MRPVRLELVGFGAFTSRTVVDLDDVEVFALVGPTGAGKSTLLDAICFALYGTVPRYDDQRLVGAAMSLGANETRVGLRFEVGGRRYDAVRVVRRGREGKVTTKEARLEEVGGAVLAGRASEMAAAVERVVGLPFEHFTRCVVLPQGAFARFLHDRPADRQQVLVQLLDLGIYEHVAAEAGRRARAAEFEAEVAGRHAARFAHASDDAVVAARATVVALERCREAVAALAAEDADGRARHAVVAAELAETEELLVRLGAVHPPEDLAVLDAELTAAVAAEARAGAEVDEAVAALDAARRARLALGDTSAAAAAVARAGERERLAATVDGQRRQRDRAAAAVATALEADAAEERALAAAVAALDAARVSSAAHVVREHLVAGGPCPVCEQPVAAVPHRPAPPAWQQARDAEAAQRRRREAARAARDEATRALATAEAALTASLASLERLDAEVAAAGGLEHARMVLAAAERGEAQERQAAAAERASREAAAKAARAVTDARDRLDGLTHAYHRQRDAVSALAPPAPAGSLADDWSALVDWARTARRATEARRVALAADLGELEQARQVLSQRVAAAFAAAGAAVPPPGSDPLDAAQRAALEAAVAAERLEADRVTRLEEAARAERAREAAVVARRLAQLLSASGFERWLVAEATERLVGRAAVTLGQLSGGQYGLVLEEGGELAVVDHANAGERRNVRTLSGGETFQAALALALALADQLRELSARSGATLESLFLDEGFGTLDPDSLDVVAATLEALGGQGRMVGVVTHVRDLAARLPVRFEVRRTPGGSIVERVAP